MRLEDQIVSGIKPTIETTDLLSVQEEYNDLFYETEFPRTVDWPYVVQKCYLHACLKKKKDIADWFQGLFTSFDPIQQIAYRQTFAYGKRLLEKKDYNKN
jgi:hypothetical protein